LAPSGAPFAGGAAHFAGIGEATMVHVIYIGWMGIVVLLRCFSAVFFCGVFLWRFSAAFFRPLSVSSVRSKIRLIS
jgi:hypothetical protein